MTNRVQSEIKRSTLSHCGNYIMILDIKYSFDSRVSMETPGTFSENQLFRLEPSESMETPGTFLENQLFRLEPSESMETPGTFSENQLF